MTKLNDDLMQAFSKVRIDSLFQNNSQQNNPMAGGISQISKLFQSDSVTNGPKGFQFDSILSQGTGKNSTPRTVNGVKEIFGNNVDLPAGGITDALTDSDLPDNG